MQNIRLFEPKVLHSLAYVQTCLVKHLPLTLLYCPSVTLPVCLCVSCDRWLKVEEEKAKGGSQAEENG